MTKAKIITMFKSQSVKGIDIAKALKAYFAQEIKAERVKPIRYYQSGELQEKNINGQKDIVATAQEIFSY